MLVATPAPTQTTAAPTLGQGLQVQQQRGAAVLAQQGAAPQRGIVWRQGGGAHVPGGSVATPADAAGRRQQQPQHVAAHLQRSGWRPGRRAATVGRLSAATMHAGFASRAQHPAACRACLPRRRVRLGRRRRQVSQVSLQLLHRPLLSRIPAAAADDHNIRQGAVRQPALKMRAQGGSAPQPGQHCGGLLSSNQPPCNRRPPRLRHPHLSDRCCDGRHRGQPAQAHMQVAAATGARRLAAGRAAIPAGVRPKLEWVIYCGVKGACGSGRQCGTCDTHSRCANQAQAACSWRGGRSGLAPPTIEQPDEPHPQRAAVAVAQHHDRPAR